MKTRRFALCLISSRTLLLRALLIVSCPPWVSLPATGAQVSAPSVEGLESEPFLRFSIWNGDTNIAQTVDYFTQDDTALAGVHYRAVSGTAWFAAGQALATVQVPLIDNGQLDGEKTFRLVLTNASPGLDIFPDPNPPLATNLPPATCGCGCPSYQLGLITDNELPPTSIDSSFVPDPSGFLAVMPDGRFLGGNTMLHSNGWVDADYVPGRGALNGMFAPLHVFPDGKILASYSPPLVYQWQFVRLLPDGAVDAMLAHLPDNTQFVAVQPDGKLLMSRRTTDTNFLFRVNSDGTYDGSFTEATFTGGWLQKVGVQSDGKILIHGRFDSFNGTEQRGLFRLHTNGSRDTNFPSFQGVDGFLLRSNGKIIVGAWGLLPFQMNRLVFQLNPDGTLDLTFGSDVQGAVNDWVEQPNGRILIPGWQPRRLNIDGSPDPTFAPQVEYPCSEVGRVGPRLLATPSGEILFGSFFYEVDGFPRASFVRFLDRPPQPDFRVFTPPEFYRSANAALIRVVRTGQTTNAASVDFSTADDTARAGVDYAPRSGTLHFAPLEVSKEIVLPLLAKTRIVNRLRFNLTFTNPSEGYAATDPMPIVIWPDLRITTEHLRTSGRVQLQGTIPGLGYSLDTSPDLRSWTWNPLTQAAADSIEFNVGLGSESTQFFRARRQ